MVAKIIKIYKTKDGSRFDSKKEAEIYVLDSIGEELDKVINTHMSTLSPAYAITRRSQMQVLLALMGDVEKCEKIKTIFCKHL